MDYEKNSIKGMEWLFFLPFFVISVLSGKLLSLNVIKMSDLLNKTILGLNWLFCIMLIISAAYGIFKLIKREYTLEKVWLFLGIFILLQFLGVYQFELLMNYYSIVLNNVLFYNLMSSVVFSIPYVFFLLLYTIKNKNKNAVNGLTGINIIILLFLLLLPILRSIDLLIYRYVVEGLQSNRESLISRIIFREDMNYSEKAKIAEIIMDQLMSINTYIDILYYIMIFGSNCVMGICLFREKITYQKYLAMGGTFIGVQFIGIVYFDKILNLIDNSFYTANINLLYKILLNYSQPLVFIIPLILYLLKKYIRIKK